MFFAAFTSRSWVVPQSHVHSRTFCGILPCKVPQTEHSLEEGNQRSIAITSRPYHWALYFFRDLKRGYFARLPNKFTNAVWRCRRACWSGTEETSLRYASSSVYFQTVSIADAWL
jgi:hypothetical protein